MNHGSLFSGIGGFDLADSWMKWRNVFQVEINDFCRKVLKKNFPKTKQYEDIKKFDGKKYTGTIDIISGGFPCQPFSVAGKRRGSEDDRYLWKEMLRVIKEINPSWIVAENVPGIINMELETVLSDLEKENYELGVFIFPACAVGAPHRRERVWIIANANGKHGNVSGLCTSKISQLETSEILRYFEEKTEPGICGVEDGISHRLDRVKSLGNAIVPQVAFRIFQYIHYIHFFRK